MSYSAIERNCHPGRVLRLAGVFCLLTLGLPRAGSAAPRQILSGGHVPAAVARLAPAGSLPGSQRLDLAIGLPLRNEQELDALLRQLYDPASPNYHRYLTPGEFTARFGPTENDYQALMDFAKSNGLTVTVTHPNRVVLDVSGAVTDIERTFHVTLRVYEHPTEARTFYAPDVEPSVDLAVPILHVSGLDNYSLPHPNLKVRLAGAMANATPNTGTGPDGTYRGSDFRTAYVPGTSLTGAGQSVGLLQFDGFYASDITSYESQAGLPSVPVTVVAVDGGVSTPGSGVDEVSLDIEMAISMAPGLAGVYVYEAPNGSPWVDLLSRMANDNLAKQLSCSWGGGSPDATAEQIFKQMGTQGQSFFNATGDSDAFTGAIDFPSDSTNITEVGGTTLTTGSDAAYSSETVWNWGLDDGSYVGSSGGISTYYAIPSYQQGISMSANQGSTTMRNVPDVALTADNVYVVYGDGSTETVGGTSCAAPLWAGFTALVNQQAAAAGQTPVGFLNPALYTIGKGASYSSCFHDITTGNNFWPSSPSKFSAVTGYDLCTGWGTPNGTNLINALAGPPILAPDIVSNSFVLVMEGCPNGAVDPGETVTVNFGLKNIGTADTTNLVATLLSTGGITSPSGPQTYGVLSTNGTAVVLPFTFTAAGVCGGTNIASLQLRDGEANLETVTFSFRLGQSTGSTVFSQNFDGVTAPALPAGWTTSTSGAQSNWVTSTSAHDTAPNALFSRDPSRVGVNEVDSPAITLPASQSQLTFRNNYNLETSYDGGVLEIKIGGGAWTDILTAGGSFVSGGYNYTLSSSYGNPLAGRQAWSGNSGGFITTLVNLPAAASGQTIQLRWRCGSDSSVSGTGWYVDTVSVTSTSYDCCTVSTDLGVLLAGSPNPVLAGQNLTYTLTVTNLGPATAASVTLTDDLPASVTFVSASPGCVNLGGNVVCSVGSLASGGGTNFTVVVTPTAAGLITNTLTVASPTADPNSANNTAASVIIVDAAPAITAQPASQVADAGTNVTLQVAAGGTAPLAYQWLFNGTNLAGAVNAALTLTNVQVAEAGAYTVRVTNAYGSVLSSNAVLTVMDPWIVGQPKNQSVTAGAPATFTVTAGGTLPLGYQWLKEGVALVDGTNISGARTATLTVAAVQAEDMGNYSVVVSNLNGEVVSSIAALVANFPSSILAQPASQTVLAGSVALFTAGVVGSSPISFQWQRDGTNLLDGGKFSGSATASLVVSNVQAGEMGGYSVVVSNTYGSVTSSNALLLVWPLLGWGRDDYSQADIPGGLTGVTGIAAGLYHSLALRVDGTVTAWGAGTTNLGSSPDYGQSMVPAGLSNVVGIAGGAFHSLALKGDGTVAAWGAGTTNSGSSPNSGQSVVPAGLSNAVAVAAGYYHSLALMANGTVIAWGDNRYGQTNSPIGLTNVVVVASGGYHSLALKADGTVVAWGAGTNNALAPNYGQAMVPAGLTNVVAVAAGMFHSLALKADGTMLAWGNNTYGQTNIPVDLTNVVAVAAGLYHNLALEADGTVVAWGNNSSGQTNIPAGLANAVELAGGGFHDLVLESDGQPALTVQPYSQVAAVGTTVTLAAMAVGAQPLTYQWQCNGTNVAGATTAQLTLPNVQISSAGTYSVVVTNALGAAVSSNATLTVLVGPGTILTISLAGTNVSISFTSVLGSNYLLEYKNSLGDPAWTPLPPPVAATGGTMVLEDTNAPASSRYYRLLRE
ncbi:MAG: immunoglobulin domain-containing protein [Limisphaerales bacterium]